ncbi:thiamine pyrophosphate-binding protein [Bacillus cereus]
MSSKTEEKLATGAQLLLEALEKEGVKVIFGYPGGAVLPLYDALYDCEIPHILTRHEQGAIHAAEGYARITGNPGGCNCNEWTRCYKCNYGSSGCDD